MESGVRRRDPGINGGCALVVRHGGSVGTADDEVREHVGGPEWVGSSDVIEQDTHPFRQPEIIRATGSSHADDLTGPPVSHQVAVVGEHQWLYGNVL